VSATARALDFTSDNAGPVHPAVMDALVAANAGHAASYGADALTARALAAIRARFEAPEAEVLLVPTGIAANALLLGALARPWQRVFCSEIAHVERDEAGAVTHASGGAQTALVPQADGRMDPAALAARIAAEPAEARGPVTLTQATEAGTLYRPEGVAEIAEVARGHGCALHMDGARLANAVAALGCTPAEVTWRAGVDALSLGGTKNGLMGVEAAVLFRPALAPALPLQRTRMGAGLSKHRFLAAQMLAALADGLWLDMAARANAAAARLAAGLAGRAGVTLAHPAEANIVFARLRRADHRRLRAAGARYMLWDMPEPALDDGPDDEALLARFVCDWTADAARVDALLDLMPA
jgi:threonine aldolase